MSQAPPAETVVSSGGDAAAVIKDKKAEEWKPRISVFNLPPGVTSRDELRELCKPFGSITEVEFVPAKGNRSAFGFVTFKTKGDAEYAIYRLNEDKFGGKVPVRAKWPPEKTVAPKEEGSSEKKPIKTKPKKQLQPLSLLTPKNVASNAQNNTQPQQFQKKGWDIPAAPAQNQQGGQQQGQQGQKKQFQQDPNRPQNPNPRKKRGNPNAQNQGQNQGQQQGQQQNPQNSHPAANHQKPGNQQPNGQHPNQQKPVHPNQGQNRGQQQKKAQNQQQHQNNEQNQQQNTQQAPANPQQGPGRKQKQQGGQQQNVPQQHQQVEQHAAPQQNNAQHTQPQNNQQQGQGQQGQQQPRPPRKNNKKNKPFVVTVSDGKTGLPLHVIHLSKPQFDQYLGPLVVKPNPQ